MTPTSEMLDAIENRTRRAVADVLADYKHTAAMLAAARDRLLLAIEQHRERRMHDRCWEHDNALYRAAGLAEVDPANPPIEEHRLACDQHRARLFDVPIEEEPCATVERLQKLTRGLAERCEGQSALLTERAEGCRGKIEAFRQAILDQLAVLADLPECGIIRSAMQAVREVKTP